MMLVMWVRERFPMALAAFLGGGVLSRQRTVASDLGVVVLIDGAGAPCRESLRWRGWPVELCVHDEKSLTIPDRLLEHRDRDCLPPAPLIRIADDVLARAGGDCGPPAGKPESSRQPTEVFPPVSVSGEPPGRRPRGLRGRRRRAGAGRRRLRPCRLRRRNGHLPRRPRRSPIPAPQQPGCQRPPGVASRSPSPTRRASSKRSTTA